jgi:hypothetical protein
VAINKPTQDTQLFVSTLARKVFKEGKSADLPDGFLNEKADLFKGA